MAIVAYATIVCQILILLAKLVFLKMKTGDVNVSCNLEGRALKISLLDNSCYINNSLGK